MRNFPARQTDLGLLRGPHRRIQAVFLRDEAMPGIRFPEDIVRQTHQAAEARRAGLHGFFRGLARRNVPADAPVAEEPAALIEKWLAAGGEPAPPAVRIGPADLEIAKRLARVELRPVARPVAGADVQRRQLPARLAEMLAGREPHFAFGQAGRIGKAIAGVLLPVPVGRQRRQAAEPGLAGTQRFLHAFALRDVQVGAGHPADAAIRAAFHHVRPRKYPAPVAGPRADPVLIHVQGGDPFEGVRHVSRDVLHVVRVHQREQFPLSGMRFARRRADDVRPSLGQVNCVAAQIVVPDRQIGRGKRGVQAPRQLRERRRVSGLGH